MRNQERNENGYFKNLEEKYWQLIDPVMLVHLPADLGRFGEEGTGFFEGSAVLALGSGGIDFLGGGEELCLVGVHAFGG